MRACGIALLLCWGASLCWLPQPCGAQWAVYDGVADANAKIELTELTTQTAYQAYNLTKMANLVLDSTYVQDLKELMAVIEEGDGLATDLRLLRIQIETLFDVKHAPATRTALDARLAEIKALRYKSQSQALRVQALGQTAVRVLKRLDTLMQRIAGLVGNMQAQQTLVQIQGSIHQILVQMQTQAKADQRNKTLDQMTDALVTESLARIQDKRMEGWPKWGQP